MAIYLSQLWKMKCRHLANDNNHTERLATTASQITIDSFTSVCQGATYLVAVEIMQVSRTSVVAVVRQWRDVVGAGHGVHVVGAVAVTARCVVVSRRLTGVTATARRRRWRPSTTLRLRTTASQTDRQTDSGWVSELVVCVCVCVCYWLATRKLN